MVQPGARAEELTERTVRDRYIVGVLAPSRAGAPSDTATEEEDEETPLIPDELAEGGRDTVDDGSTDRDVPVPAGHLPSSVGMTFCVDAEAKTIKVSAFWGQYKREVREEQINDRTGKPIRVWQRYSRGGVIEIPLTNGPVKATAPDAEFDDIYVQGQIRKRDSHWVVTLFLINAQEEGRPKDESHIFQPSLTVEAADGKPIFCKRMAVGSNDDLEEHLMAMLYRHHVEFAVGHGVSVHADVSEESSELATLIRTEFVPRYEVPRTAPPNEEDAEENPAFGKLKGLVLDMKELADADAKKLPKMLGPLVTAYREWINGEAKKLDDPSEGLDKFGAAPPEDAIKNCRLTLERIEAGLQLLQQDAQAIEAFQFMNRAMWLQRTHSIYAEQVRRGGQPDFDKDIDVSKNRSWRPFQIAFILLNIPGVTKLDHPERAEGPDALADLLFFPTGGGKTEAYLGLSAYTMGLRRLQGVVLRLVSWVQFSDANLSSGSTEGLPLSPLPSHQPSNHRVKGRCEGDGGGARRHPCLWT